MRRAAHWCDALAATRFAFKFAHRHSCLSLLALLLSFSDSDLLHMLDSRAYSLLSEGGVESRVVL